MRLKSSSSARPRATSALISRCTPRPPSGRGQKRGLATVGGPAADTRPPHHVAFAGVAAEPLAGLLHHRGPVAGVLDVWPRVRTQTRTTGQSGWRIPSHRKTAPGRTAGRAEHVAVQDQRLLPAQKLHPDAAVSAAGREPDSHQTSFSGRAAASRDIEFSEPDAVVKSLQMNFHERLGGNLRVFLLQICSFIDDPFSNNLRVHCLPRFLKKQLPTPLRL
jgi:hypothetical protein